MTKKSDISIYTSFGSNSFLKENSGIVHSSQLSTIKPKIPSQEQFETPVKISVYASSPPPPKNLMNSPHSMFSAPKRVDYLNVPLVIFTFFVSLIVLSYGSKMADYFLRALLERKNEREDIAKIYEALLLNELEKVPNKPKNLFFQQLPKEDKTKIFAQLWAFSKLTLDLDEDIRKKLTEWSTSADRYLRTKKISTKEYNFILKEKEKLLEKYSTNENQKKSKFR